MTDTSSTANDKQVYVIMGWLAPFGRPLPLVPPKFFAFCSTPANRAAVAKDLAAEKKWFLQGVLSVDMVDDIATSMKSVPNCLNVVVTSPPDETELTPFGAYRYFPLTDPEEEVDATVARICTENNAAVRVFINADMVRQMQSSIAALAQPCEAA